jgi:zinc protease
MLRRRHVLLLAALALASPARGAAPPVREVTLANGLVVLLAPDSLAATADVALWVHAGTRWEATARSGATHLLERIAIEGSWSAPVGRALGDTRDAGGAHSTYTTADVTSVFETAPPEALVSALRIHAGLLMGPTLTADQVAKEKRGANDSIARRGDGGLIGRALQRLYSELFGSHPYALQVTGDQKQRDAIAAAALQSWGAEHFSPSNAMLTVVGRFQPDSALAAIRRTVGAVPRRAAPSLPAAPLPPVRGPRRVVLDGPERVVLLVGGWRGPGGTDSARVVLPVLSRLLSQGPRSALSRVLVAGDPAPCLRIEGAVSARANASVLYFLAVVRDAADSAVIDSAVSATARQLATAPVADEDLERAKTEVELRLLDDRQTARGRALALGTAWSTTGNWESADEDLRRLRALTAEDVRAAAERLLKPESYVTVWMAPANAGGAEGAR